MKEPKPLTSLPGGQSGLRQGPTEVANGGRREQDSPLGAAEQEKSRPKPPMQNETQTRRTRGRLGRDVQSKLGKTLQAYFDDVVKEGVPDRFRDLLRQYDQRKDKGSA